MRQRILLSVPHMDGGELAYVHHAFETNWLSTVGPNIVALEHAFETRLGVPAVALSSGTAAIHLGLRLLGVRPDDRVFCPTLTFTATCNPVRYLGAEPEFIDSAPSNWNLDPNILESALRRHADRGRLPRAVIVVHLYGQCADMDPILDLCRRYEVPVLEDAAQALGATYKSRAAGTMGKVGVFSFNGNKIITTTGGGLLVSANPAWVEKARFWSQQARDPGLAYEHSELGYNYRMSNVLAGIGRGQLEVLDQRIRQRRGIAFRYRDAFADLPGIALMPQAAYGLHTNWLSTFLIDEAEFGCSRDELIRALDEANIESRPVWKPMHLQPLYAGCVCHGGAVAEDLFRCGICLPSSSSLSEDDQLYVVNAIRRAAGADSLENLARRGGERLHTEPVNVASTTVSSKISRTDVPTTEVSGLSIETLLGRPPVQFSDDEIRPLIENKVVVVTGAAGSIGSELCRQIARLSPASIVGFDIAESPLFELEMQMRAVFPSVAFHAEIGSVQSAARVDELLRRHKPSVIYHAAAYKHVPMMESHIVEAVENNVVGTYNLALAAIAHSVKHFVLISSDKAVKPASIMGVTKRLAELVVSSMQHGATRFVAVRFGNVLGSNGSAVPIFQSQIAAGGPLTITHPEMQRFFMTAPEACQLVLQAAAIGQGGQICVLDMGAPIRIVDLAEKLIAQAGPGARDIRIEYTGIRPGEKLSEELSEMLEGTLPTGHEKIRIYMDDGVDRVGFERHFQSLRNHCADRDVVSLVKELQEWVPGYKPSDEVRKQLTQAHDASRDAADERAEMIR